MAPPPKVLYALDSAKLQYYHIKATIIAGMGLFTDAYDLFCISPVMELIGRVYYDEDGSPAGLVSLAIGISLLGTVMGKLVFGRLGDLIGRRKIYGVTLLLMVCSAIGSGFSICRTRKCAITSLCFFRFLLGVGIGGDYPLSAVIASEFANKDKRGSLVAGVFSMQGFGILTSSAVTMTVCAVFNSAAKSHQGYEADLAWRLILMLGAIPAAMTFYWRMMLPETPRYTALVEMNIRQAVKDMERVLDVSHQQITEEFEFIPDPPSYGILSKQFFRRYGRDLFACATAWFLVDIVFYSTQLFQFQIYKAKIKKIDSLNAYQEALRIAMLQGIIALSSTIPGYWVSVFLIDRMGRRKIQMMGFFAMGICLFALAIPYQYWYDHNNPWFFLLYGLTFFWANFGPNTTTFIVPAELFPVRFRSTCHGISGAAGKLGAIIGSIGFLWASQSTHSEHVKDYDKWIGMFITLVILGAVCVVGMVLTYFLTPETNGRSLEENEDEEGAKEMRWLRASIRKHSVGAIHMLPS